MQTSNATSTTNARATYCIRAGEVVEVLCHRRFNGIEEFLVRWKTNPIWPRPPRAVCSWHSLPDLWDNLHLIQPYVEKLQQSGHRVRISNGLSTLPANRKRKSPESDPEPSRDLSRHGLLTPGTSADRSRSPSVSNESTDDFGPRIYNGVLQKKAGHLIAKRSEHENVVQLNPKNLPTEAMRRTAANLPLQQAEYAVRQKFLEMLKPVKGVRLENKVDNSTPSLNFTFIDSYVYGDGVYVPDPETYEGCMAKCKPNMGQNIGCEYPGLCECLEYGAVDERKLQAKDPQVYTTYMRHKARNGVMDTMGLPKRFPYQKSTHENVPMKLVTYYREQRHPIYECNDNCKCGHRCKSRLVQRGRRVKLCIFKTENRGWGIKADEELVQGEFIDTYLGEVITNDEANLRENQSGQGKESYLYSLDKFVGEQGITNENCYVVDGQHMGGITRFINHSCEPNCRQYTVSYNKNDSRLYNLAFFAYEDIPKGTELVFDYMDNDEEEEEDAIRKYEEAARDPANKDKLPCNCGTRKCRGFLW